MKKSLFTLACLALAFVACNNEKKDKMETEEPVVVVDTTATETPEMTEEPMDSVAMQKAWEAYMTPGEPHKMMAAEEGKWNNEMTFWMGPEEEKATSTTDIKMIMGGRYQVGTYTGNMMGADFEGRSTLAYDNATNEYISTWIDNMGTGLGVLRGTYDEGNKTIILKGNMVDPITGKEKQVREVYTIVDDNTRRMEMYETGPDGKEVKTMEILMKRA
jgi:hypothetical protein